MPRFLHVEFPAGEIGPEPHERFLPFAASGLFGAAIKRCRELARGPEVKTVYELSLDIEGISFEYKPGDAIGVIPQNDSDEVQEIIARLGFDGSADRPYVLSLSGRTTKKKAAIPKHVPRSGTVRGALLKHLDIRSAPRKLFLKGLLDYATADEDKEKLRNLSDPKQSAPYQEFITHQGKTLLGLLNHLRSCNPSIEFLLETLPPLQPRYYSVASSPLVTDELVIVFSVVNQNGIKGVCTGWLENCARNSPGSKIEFYFRKSSEFLKFEESQTALIMIGPGTGVAPFIGFLQDVFLRRNQLKFDDPMQDMQAGFENLQMEENVKNIALYFGCRYPDKDYIYESELLGYLESKVLGRLSVAFSRRDNVYIQDKLEVDGAEITDCILKQNAVVCVCGDAKNLGRSVEEKLVTLLVKHGGKSVDKADEYLKGMRAEKRFQLDVWL